MFLRVATACLLTTFVACTPMHTVRPLPEFVQLALAPGDFVLVTLHDGTVIEMTVAEVRPDALVGGEHSIALNDIATMQKRAWEEPPSPCGGNKPLGCSVPLLVVLASESDAHYKDAFHDACVQHDYCYRHGHRSYGHARNDCDEEFLRNMLTTCPEPAEGMLKKTFELFSDSVESRRQCESTANRFHSLVRRFGEKHFLIQDSSYCEYDGTPATP